MTNTKDAVQPQVTVIGAGIVGLCSALELQSAGCRVTIIDPQQSREAASYGNAGIIAVNENQPLSTPELLKQLPRLLLSPTSPVSLRLAHLPAFIPWGWRFMRAAQQTQIQRSASALASLLTHAYPAFKKLLADTEGAGYLQQSGWLKLFSTEQGLAAGLKEQQAACRFGAKAEELSADEVRELEPHLAPMAGAVFYPECAQIHDPGQLLDHLQQVFLQRGGEWHQGRALGLQQSDQGPTAVITTEGSVACQQLLICAGAWSKHWTQQLGSPLPLDTERGYHLMFNPANNHLLQRPILWSEQALVLNPMTQGLRLTSGVEFAGLKAKPNYSKIMRLAERATALLPELQRAIEDRWLGFRPSLPDSLPVISRSPKFRNCFFAFGHGHLGLTLGPITGRLVRELICDQPTTIDLTPFSAQRFH